MKTMSIMNSLDDPWRYLDRPSSAHQLKSRRVNPEHPWDFFWARTTENHYLLILQHHQTMAPDRSLPNFQGFKVSNLPSGSTDRSLLTFELLETQHRELFQRLCHDIVESTTSASDEATAVETAIGRTWRWHHLLRGGTDDRLSIEEQRGLIGELLTIADLLQPHVGIRAAVDSWSGPIGTPKDFELGTVCIEHKARRSAARPMVRIASGDQLDGQDIEHLYLIVRDVDQVPVDTPNAMPLTGYIEQIDKLIEDNSDTNREFHARLAALGFRWTDDYSDTCWVTGKRRIYCIGDGFPRIAASELPDGIKEVAYSITLKSIEQFEVRSSQLELSHHADQH